MHWYINSAKTYCHAAKRQEYQDYHKSKEDSAHLMAWTQLEVLPIDILRLRDLAILYVYRILVINLI